MRPNREGPNQSSEPLLVATRYVAMRETHGQTHTRPHKLFIRSDAQGFFLVSGTETNGILPPVLHLGLIPRSLTDHVCHRIKSGRSYSPETVNLSLILILGSAQDGEKAAYPLNL
jgi:hypothetical protein